MLIPVLIETHWLVIVLDTSRADTGTLSVEMHLWTPGKSLVPPHAGRTGPLPPPDRFTMALASWNADGTLINGPSGMNLAVGQVARLLPVKSGKNGRFIRDVSAPLSASVLALISPATQDNR